MFVSNDYVKKIAELILNEPKGEARKTEKLKNLVVFEPATPEE